MIKRDLTKIFIDEIYSKPPRKNYPTNKIVYNFVDEIWSIDLADFSDYKTSNKKGFRYIFIVIETSQNICGLYLLKINIVKLSQTNFQIF